jgi:crotonobetainyl-CoA:carnitine CoA-transferase CaiB-like acyl-CoA transferase
LAVAIGRADLVADERFATGKGRRKNARELTVELDAAFATLPFAEITRRLNALGLVWAPLQTPADVADDPQAEAAGAFLSIDAGNAKPSARRRPQLFFRAPMSGCGRALLIWASTPMRC